MSHGHLRPRTNRVQGYWIGFAERLSCNDYRSVWDARGTPSTSMLDGTLAQFRVVPGAALLPFRLKRMTARPRLLNQKQGLSMLSIMVAATFLQSAAANAAQLSNDEVIARIEPAIRANMVEPESTRLSWPYGWARRKDRSVTCGVVNGRNLMGGYSGDTFVMLVRPDGGAPFYRIAESQSSNDGVTGMCEQMIERGQFARN